MASFASGLLSGATGAGSGDNGNAKKALQKLRQKRQMSKAVKAPLPTGGRDQSYLGELASPPSYKRGGKVRKTGMAKVHKGERVLTKRQQRRMRRGRSKGR